jgi:2-oxoglutarate dehydrogenase E1 component
MAREDANQAFAQTSFLYGANAPYLEDLQARYARDPASVDAEWRAFFEQLRDAPDAEVKPSWQRPDWPVASKGDLISALDGNWAEVATGVEKKIKAAGGRRRRIPSTP